MHTEAGAQGQNRTDAIVDLIAMGICEDQVLENYVTSLAEGAGQDERRAAARKIADVALASNDADAIARSLNALKHLLPLDHGVEDALDKKLLALADRGIVAGEPELARSLALFVYARSRARARVARPYLPMLMSLLSGDMATTGACSYYTLMIVARSAPHYFEDHAGVLVQMLGNPGTAEKVFAMRIIAALASSRPELVAGARDLLHDLSENGPQELLRAEAAKAYETLRSVPGAPENRTSSLLDDPALASLYEVPVWQRAVKSHLSTAYPGTPIASVRKPAPRKAGRSVRPSKRYDLYQEFIDKLKAGEPEQSFESQIRLITPEVIVPAASVETTPAEIPVPAGAPADDVQEPVVDIVDIAVKYAAEANLDPEGNACLQDMMNDVQNEFSAQAGGLLDALGMGHLMRGSARKADEGGHRISGKELVSALEKLIKQHNGKAM